MIKKILLSTISFYQIFISAILKNVMGVNRMCRFSPTCSEYSKQMVKKYGAFGVLLSMKRIGACW